MTQRYGAGLSSGRMGHPQAKQQYDRLRAFCVQDPSNEFLLADVFEAAVHLGEFDDAGRYLEQGTRLSKKVLEWRFRASSLYIAEQRYDVARKVLEELVSELPQQAAIVHDLAYVAMRQSRFEDSRALIEKFWASFGLSAGAEPAAVALQCLWLRCLHSLGAVNECMDWLKARNEDKLHPQVANVASLVAVDAAEFELARQWSDDALHFSSQQLEALVARSSVALALGDTTGAREVSLQVLNDWPAEGRAWSVLGFSDLMEQRLDQAQIDFEKAVYFMPDHIGTWHGFAWTFLSRGSFKDAGEAFQRALELDRSFAESHGGMAIVLALLDRREAAMHSIDLAMALDRSSLSAQFATAILNGQVYDQQTLQSLAKRLLGRIKGPLGRSVYDWVEKNRRSTD